MMIEIKTNMEIIIEEKYIEMLKELSGMSSLTYQGRSNQTSDHTHFFLGWALPPAPPAPPFFSAGFYFCSSGFFLGSGYYFGGNFSGAAACLVCCLGGLFLETSLAA